jgi:hypothetical protein
LEELLSAPAVQFKGSGWYVTDYARKGHAPAASSSEGEGVIKDTAKETKKEEKPKTEPSHKKHKKD